MDDLGYLDDPGDQLGMLDGAGVAGRPGDRRHRHAPGAGDPARTTRSASTRASAGRRSWAGSSCGRTAGWPTRSCASSCNRYLGWPGQAPSYKVGERIWLQARDDAKARKGPDFDLRRSTGTRSTSARSGLDPLRKALARL